MWKDPIVEEIHKTREQIAGEYDYDLNCILNYLRKKEIENSDRVVYKKSQQRARNLYLPTPPMSTRTLHPTSSSVDAPDLSDSEDPGSLTIK